MGIVVAAMHIHLEQRVAFKFLLPAALKHPDVVARFTREARAASKIKSEHVGRVIDVGALDDGTPFMIMEYLDGEDLDQVLAKRGALPVQEAIGYLLEACEALAEAHAIGIVHRDLKPANMFLAQTSGRHLVKVLDFGISKALDGKSEAGLTKTAAIIGSPYYMSPEQLTEARNVDARSDIWALGIVLHELLTARHPFDAETMPELVGVILAKPPAQIAEARTDVPAGVQDVISRALSKDPNGRFANVAELVIALAPYGGPRSEVSVERVTRALGKGATRDSSPMAKSLATRELPVTAPIAEDERKATAAPWSRTNTGGLRTRKVARVTVVVGICVLGLATLLTFALRHRSQTPAVVQAPSAAYFGAAPAPEPLPKVAPEPTSSSPALAEPSAAPPPPKAIASFAPRIKPVARPAPSADAPPPATVPAPVENQNRLKMDMK